ncbi:uncharacterized protein LOC132643936 [Lycium barbarum]|uniref:uncharacterized protein LOC132643936 n=1 Tax=Lycium barbarum TaxID=112863 RepID=UPI00293F3FCC|nr:uncharacterized protein LOC132643936 [Lycium barbarum]
MSSCCLSAVQVVRFVKFTYGCSSNQSTILRKVPIALAHSLFLRYNCSCAGQLENADPCVQSDSFKHWYKNWKELRKYKLTASTFGQAVGLWPKRRVQLWEEKIGMIKPLSVRDHMAMRWNNIKEKEAIVRYSLITDNIVSFKNFQVYREMNVKDNWLAASPDGVIDKSINPLPSKGILEIKCPYFDGDKNKMIPWKRLPIYYVPQAQGLMEILDRDWIDVYGWTINGSSLFRLFRDKEYWQLLETALSDFWWKHVQPAKELCKGSKIANSRVYEPKPRHELLQQIIYQSRCVLNNSEFVMREIGGKLSHMS